MGTSSLTVNDSKVSFVDARASERVSPNAASVLPRGLLLFVGVADAVGVASAVAACEEVCAGEFAADSPQPVRSKAASGMMTSKFFNWSPILVRILQDGLSIGGRCDGDAYRWLHM